MKVFKINSKDNVIVALEDIKKSENHFGINLLEDIPFGHKIALKDIKKNENIIKYGFNIGHATKYIKKGSLVHTHNVMTNLNNKITYNYNYIPSTLKNTKSKTFLGYRRQNDKIGIRNEIWIIPTVGCVNGIVTKLVQKNKHLEKENISSLQCFTHPYGCSQMGDDNENTKKILSSLIKHPNAGAVLVVSLGCENINIDALKKDLGDFNKDRVKFLVCQNTNDEIKKGSEILKKLFCYANTFTRTELSSSELVVGMKCGGSDGLSGITANAVVGKFSDILISSGGSTILTEVPEMFGAERMLMNRCLNENVFNKTVSMICDFKDYFTNHNQVIYENPSPGNKNGGITTLEDKSCGCVQKSGTANIIDVLNYGEKVKKNGLTILNGPGNDLVSTTALTAADAHIILFTTGRGTPFGAPVPTIKISSNTALYKNHKNWIDFNTGTVAENIETIDESAEKLLNFVLTVASGKNTKNEINDYREISIFKSGVIL